MFVASWLVTGLIRTATWTDVVEPALALAGAISNERLGIAVESKRGRSGD